MKNTFKAGKLYLVEKHYWFLLSPEDILPMMAPIAAATATPEDAEVDVVHLREMFNCQVACIYPNSTFCLLEQSGDYLKVISSKGEVGWMIYPDEPWTKYCIQEVIL